MVDRSWRLIVFYVIITVVTAFFSYSVAYLRELSESKLEKLADIGNKRAKKLLKIAENHQSISSLQSVIILLTALAFLIVAFAFPELEDVLNKHIGHSMPSILYEILSFLILTLCSGTVYAVFVHRIPTRLGIYHAKNDRTIRGIGILKMFIGIGKPFLFLYSGFSRILLGIFGIDDRIIDSHVTEDEIMDMVDLGEESGNIESGEKEMIENIFDFTDITVSNLMTHRTDVSAIDVNSSDDEIYRVIGDTGFSRFPVYQEDIDHIIGILNAKTYLLERASGSTKTLRKLLYKPYLVPETVHADRLLSDMRKNKVHMAIVLDEYGGTSGIVTMEDLLEEIVGNIYDETDKSFSDQELIPLSENRFRAAGSLSLSALSEEIGISFDNESSDTLGGLIFSRLTLIPEDGSKPVLDIDGLHIEVEEIRGRRVEWALITKPVTNEEAENDNEDLTVKSKI